MRIHLIAVLATVLLPLPCLADTMYTYAGNSFTAVSGEYTTSDSVSGEFTLASSLAANMTIATITPDSFSFTDGIHSVTSENIGAGSGIFAISTDSAGNIDSWAIQIVFNDPTAIVIVSRNLPGVSSSPFLDLGIDLAPNTSGSVTDDPGIWTASAVTAPVPESSSLMLVATGIVGAAASIRRRCNHD
jgi:hypothetical protein